MRGCTIAKLSKLNGAAVEALGNEALQTRLVELPVSRVVPILAGKHRAFGEELYVEFDITRSSFAEPPLPVHLSTTTVDI